MSTGSQRTTVDPEGRDQGIECRLDVRSQLAVVDEIDDEVAHRPADIARNHVDDRARDRE